MNEIQTTNITDSLSEIIRIIANTRDYVRATQELINDYVTGTGEKITPFELRLAIDMLTKIDFDLAYYDYALSDDIQVIRGKKI